MMNMPHNALEPDQTMIFSKLDQFAAAIAGLAQPDMSPTESFHHFLEYSAEFVSPDQGYRALGLDITEDISDILEPLIAHHMRQFHAKDILPKRP